MGVARQFLGAIKKAVRELQVNWQPSVPGVHQTNAIIENINGDIEMGTKAALFKLASLHAFGHGLPRATAF